MTAYDILESSVDSGEPAELYRVTYGTQIITVTSGDRQITHAGEVYLPYTMKRTETMQTSDLNKALLTLTTTKNNPIPELFRLGSPNFPIYITVFRQHTAIADSDFVTIYKGRVSNCRFTKMEAEINCDPIFTGLKRPGLRIKYEPTCANGLYDVGCTLNKELFKTTGTVSWTDGRRQFIIPAAKGKAADYFVGGMMNLNGLHMISDYNASTGKITLVRHTIGAAVGDAVSLYPGCDHSRTVCYSRFANINNYKGFPWMADRNPFQDNTINFIN
jgi:uncharacterized phage protein (TIGR02218 family)